MYVVVPRVGDTATVRVASGSVQVGDTLHAVVRETGGEWYLIGTLVLTAVLIGVTIWTHRQVHRLQVRNTDLQGEHAKLQRELNEMHAQHESQQREDQRRRDEEQRRATDARSSGIAFALRRQLISWTDENPQEMGALLALTDGFAELDKQHGGSGHGTALKMPIPPPNVLHGAIQWALEKQQHFNRAEERMLQLVATAPEGTPAVAESIRRVYVLFYQATSRLNQQVARDQAHTTVEAPELGIAYHEFERCALELGAVVGNELLKTEELIARPDWTPSPKA